MRRERLPGGICICIYFDGILLTCQGMGRKASGRRIPPRARHAGSCRLNCEPTALGQRVLFGAGRAVPTGRQGGPAGRQTCHAHRLSVGSPEARRCHGADRRRAALRRRRLPTIAIPGTHAGSEATNMRGPTEASRKTTDIDNAVPSVAVVNDAEPALSLPVAPSVASGLNALATAWIRGGARGPTRSMPYWQRGGNPRPTPGPARHQGRRTGPGRTRTRTVRRPPGGPGVRLGGSERHQALPCPGRGLELAAHPDPRLRPAARPRLQRTLRPRGRGPRCRRPQQPAHSTGSTACARPRRPCGAERLRLRRNGHSRSRRAEPAGHSGIKPAHPSCGPAPWSSPATKP
jgi:hypothetical protein